MLIIIISIVLVEITPNHNRALSIYTHRYMSAYIQSRHGPKVGESSKQPPPQEQSAYIGALFGPEALPPDRDPLLSTVRLTNLKAPPPAPGICTKVDQVERLCIGHSRAVNKVKYTR